MPNGTHTLEVWGDLACFTRPEMKVERFSYPVITPSAARGIFDAIYWDGKRENQEKKSVVRPYFYWQIIRIELLEMPRYIALRRNEVKNKAPADRTIKRWIEGGESPEPIWGDGGKDELGTDQKGRTQRQTMALKNVRYRLTGQIIPKSGSDSNKLNASFQRRARTGKCFQQPYFGCREFPAFFEYVDNPSASPTPTAPFDTHVGLMLYDVFDLRQELTDDDPGVPFVTLFDAWVRNGILDVPPFNSDFVKKPGRE